MEKNSSKALQCFQKSSDKGYSEGMWRLAELTHNRKENAYIQKLVSKNNAYGFLLRGRKSRDHTDLDLIEASLHGFSFPFFKLGYNFFKHVNDIKDYDRYVTSLLQSSHTKNSNICLFLSHFFLHQNCFLYSLFFI